MTSPPTRAVALVTGVSRRAGIGAAIARRLAADGFDLVLQGWEPHDAGQRWGADSGALDTLAAELRTLGCDVSTATDADLADFSRPDAPARLVATALARHGRLDALIANHARSVHPAPLAELTATELDLSYAVNSRATLLLVKEFAAVTVGGRIVLLTSGQNNGPMPAEIPYAASKAALAGITASLAAALAPQHTTVNCVNPGPTDTGWADPSTTAAIIGSSPAGRWGTPEDAARLISWLVGPDGGWVTGQTLTSDGGFNLARP